MSGPSRLRPEKTPDWRKLQAFGRRLEHAGYLDATDRTHVKRIVVIGGQSAGKSALVSMLTAVKLESSMKATTRSVQSNELLFEIYELTLFALC